MTLKDEIADNVSAPTETIDSLSPKALRRDISALSALVTKQAKIIEKLEVGFAKSNATAAKAAKRAALVRSTLDKVAHSVGCESSLREEGERPLNEQEKFWVGVEGTAYAINNFAEIDAKSSKLKLWSAILTKCGPVESLLELGCNVGLNLMAIHQLHPSVALSAVELNPSAAKSVRELGYVDVHEVSILDFMPDRKWDLTIVRGVLMHLRPDDLPTAYDVMDKSADKWIAICENYSQEPEVVVYRGRDDLLMSRDFAAEFCSRYARWSVVDSGWDRRNVEAPSNRDIKWYLLKST